VTRRGPGVLQILRRRLATRDGRRSTAWPDGARLGLAVEGGGSRGAVSAAMLKVLADRGATEVFDGVYGSSAGALNATYFLAGRAGDAVGLYRAALVRPPVLDRRRVLAGRPALDVDRLLALVLDEANLDLDRVLRSPVELGVDLTLVDPMEAACITSFRSRDDLWEALRGSIWRPFEAGGATTYLGRRVVDGAVLRPLPSVAAAAAGCTHVLSLLTKPPVPPPAHLSPLHRATVWRLNRLRPGLGKLYREALRDRVRVQHRQARDEQVGPGALWILDVAPAIDDPHLANWESDPGAVGIAVEAATATMERLLGPIGTLPAP
jgi:predicted acylesterase/phospholipase RssA